MTMKLSKNKGLILLGALAVVAIVGYIVYMRSKKSKEAFHLEKTGQYMVGVHGSKSLPVDYNLPHQIHPNLDEYHKEGNRDVSIPADKLGELGVQRELGYGSDYHIVGEKAYPCSNDPNDLTKIACGVDDYSLWQDGTKRDFDHNPVYGNMTYEGLRSHKHEHNPYNYNESGDCRCTSNVNPRHSFDVSDSIVKASTPLNKGKY